MAGRSPLDNWKHQSGSSRPGRAAGPVKSRRRSRLVFVLVPLLLAVGTAIGLLFYIQPKPQPLVLSVCVAEYDTWPVNELAQQDGEGLKRTFENTNVVSHGQEASDKILSEVAALAESARRNRSQPAIIHVCALAAVDQGQVAILPAKADPGNPGTWLPLARFLEAVGKVGGNLLLILDLRPVGDPRLGQAGSDLGPALHAQLLAAEKADQLPFMVLAQCAPAEYPFVSPEFRRGVLAEFLRRGLTGHADRAGNQDDRVSAEELVNYTRSRVAHWLARHQAPVVVPARYGRTEDFVLVTVPQRVPEDDPVEDAPAASARIAEWWTKLDTWRADGAVHKVPRTFRQLEEVVVRADRRWLSGPAEVIEKDLMTNATRLDEQRTALELPGYPVSSVGVARSKGLLKEKEDEIRKLMRPLLEPLGRPRGKKEEGPPKIVPIPEKLPEEPPYNGIVAATLQSIDDLTRPPSIDQLRLYVELLKTLKSAPDQQELALLVFFADAGNTIRYRELWPDAAAQAALRAAVGAWQAAATDGRAFNWIEKPLGEANTDFRTALLTLFVPNDSERARAADSLDKLADRYRRIAAIGRAHEKAVAEWEETIALLPAVADFAPENGTARQDLDLSWTALVRKATTVREALDNRADAPLLEQAAADLKAQRDDFRKQLRTVPPDATPVELRARLRLPIWTAGERVQRTGQANAAALELTRRVLAEDAPRLADEARARGWDDPRFADLAERRQRRANDLLGLAAREPTGQVVGAELRRALVDRLVEQYSRAPSPAARERFAWLIDTADLPALPVGDGPPNDPGSQARRDAERDFAQWLDKEHLRPLADGLKAQPAEAAKALAGELEKAARALRRYP